MKIILLLTLICSIFPFNYWLYEFKPQSPLIREVHTIVGIFLFSLYTIWLLKQPFKFFDSLKINLPLTILLLLSLILYPFSPSYSEANRYLFRISYVLVFSAFFVSYVKSIHARWIVKFVILWGGGLAIAPFVLWLFTGEILLRSSPEGVKRFAGIGAAETYGLVMGFLVIVSYVLLRNRYYLKSYKGYLLMILWGILCISTFTRSAIILTLITIAMIELLIYKHKASVMKILSFFLVILLVIYFLEPLRERFYLNSYGYDLKEKVFLMLGGRTIPMLYVWNNMTLWQIITGLGPGGANYMWSQKYNMNLVDPGTVQIENEYLLVIFNLGLIGIIIYLWFFWSLFKSSLKIAKNSNIEVKTIGILGLCSLLYHFLLSPSAQLFHNYIYSVVFLYFPLLSLVIKKDLYKQKPNEF